MNNLSLPAFLTGLVALAGILFLLQRLRVRYREQTVVTTLFWKEALMEARRRVLVRSFKHPLAYLFVLLIGSLMWLGFADPELESASARSHLVLLDGSAAMGRGDRFRETVRELQEHVSELPASRRRVVFCGGRAGSLLEPGESLLLLEERVGDLVPEACPPSVERVLRSLTRHLPPDAELEVVVAGDAPLSETMLELLPKGVRVSRLAPGSEDGERPAAPNRGITALGVGAASSGAFDRVDVLCELRGPDGETPALAVLLDGNPVELEARRSREGNRTRILLVDVPASGRLLTLHLAHDSQAGDALSADDTATLRLPERSRIRVSLAPELAASVGAVLRADPAVLLTDKRPDVVVSRAAKVQDAGGSAAPLVFVPMESQEEAILLHDPELPSQRLLDSFQDLGLDQVDAMDLAEASGQRILLGASSGAERRGISVWEALLSPRFNFVGSRSFPLFVAHAIRWLAGVAVEPDFVASGEAVRGRSMAHVDASGRLLDPAGADFVPPRAGSYRARDGQILAASLLDPGVTVGKAGVALEALPGDGAEGDVDLALWLAAAVLALLILEWFLFGRGRMP